MRRSFPFALAACGLSVSAAVPAAAQDLQVYGQARLTVNNVKTGSAGSITEERDNASRLGFRGKEDLGDGLTALFGLEMGLEADSGAATTPAFRNSYAALRGSLGTVALGRLDSANPTGSRLLKRLQSEAQMLFYTHPVHDARTGRGLLPVNGFWVHGAGALDPVPDLAEAPAMPDALRQAALRNDWAAWKTAWEALDAGEIAALLDAARRGEPVTLTLCGERHARTWTTAPAGAFARLGRTIKHLFGTAPVAGTLKDL